MLKAVEAPRDPIILLNRSAAYIGLKRYGKFLIRLAKDIAVDGDCHCYASTKCNLVIVVTEALISIPYMYCILQVCPCIE